MSRMLKRFFYIYVANVSVLMSVAFASGADKSALDFRVDRNDVSLQLLEQIFGLVDGILYGTGTQVVGKMFAVFNAAVLALGGIFLTYTLLVSTINTAQDGEVMGKQWSSIWIPIRVTCGVGLLVPKASGYCMMQVFVMWIVVQGIGAANQVWSASLDYLQDGGVLVSKPMNTADTVGKPNTNPMAQVMGQPNSEKSPLSISGKLLNNLVCMNALRASLEQWQSDLDRNNVPMLERVPDFDMGLRVKELGQTIDMPNIQSDSRYYSLNGVCGSVTINFNSMATSQAVNDVTAEQMNERIQQATVAGSQQLIDELNRTAKIIVDRNNQQMANLRNAISPIQSGAMIDPNRAGEIEKDAREEFENFDGLGQCDNPDTCANWVASSGSAPLLSGYELQTAILSYYAIVMPYLNALNRDAKKLEFIPGAKKQGWIMAGSYFFDMTRLKSDIRKLQADKFFKIEVDGNISRQYFIDPGFSGKMDTVETKVVAVQEDRMGLFDNYIKPQTDVVQSITKATGGVLFIWRPDNEFYPIYDNNTEALIKDLKNKQTPVNVFGKKAKYNAYFSLRDLLRIPYIKKPGKKKCSFWKMGKCIGESIGNAVGAIIVSIIYGFFAIILAFIDLVEQAINESLGRLVNMGLNELFAKITSADGHPIVNMASAGEDMMEFAWDTLLVLLIPLLILAIFAPGAADTIWKVVVKRIVAVLMIFLVVFGYSFAFYAPLLPWMIFLFAALGWCIAVIEAMVAAPIVALGLTHPEGQNQVFGKAEQAIMIIINVFLRPSLMIIGFIIAIVLSYAFIQLAALSFAKLNDTLMGVDSNNGGALMADYEDIHNQGTDDSVTNTEGKTGVTGVLGPVMMLFIFMFIYMEIVKKCFSLTYLLPDQILRWLSGGVAEQFGSQTAGQMEQAVSQGYNKAEQSGAPTPKALDGGDSLFGKMKKGKEDGKGSAGGGGGGGGDAGGGGGGGGAD